MPHWEAMCLKARGQLHAARGDNEAARKDLDAAIEIFERLESRLKLGRSLVLRGGLMISNAPVGSSKLVAQRANWAACQRPAENPSSQSRRASEARTSSSL